MFILFKN